jgi:hypothetical protein
MLWVGFLLVILLSAPPTCPAAETPGPEEVLRTLVRANAEMDLATMTRLMAHDADVVNYSIGGRKYVEWTKFARDVQHEFEAVARLEIPITELKVWTRADTAWFAMELDYIRYVRSGQQQERTVLPLRETGVLERRAGRWVLVAWHESLRSEIGATSISDVGSSPSVLPPDQTADLSGEWEIHEEERSYRAVLDRQGNGTYTWQNGRITTTGFADRKWQGTWKQPGNDREGGFELLLSEDGTQAKGVWWYTRVGDKTNIPPRQWGGTYTWKRVTAAPIKGAIR